ncbi:hypothetical protein M3Y98_00704900 [Aphelenchoides besseyi]|nr:hypothetical protein M3Y98_00704900 [Aphelenchoides besseyi]
MVIYLCLYKISKPMKSYRPMLIFGCIIDTVYTTISSITHILVVDKSTRMIFVMESPFIPITYQWTAFAVVVWVLCIHAMIHNVSTQFVNRLNMFCWQNRLSQKQIMLFFFVCFLWSTAHCINIYFVFNEHNDPRTIEELMKTPIFRESSLGPYIAGDTLKLPMILEQLDIQLIVTFAYATIIYSAKFNFLES